MYLRHVLFLGYTYHSLMIRAPANLILHVLIVWFYFYWTFRFLRRLMHLFYMVLNCLSLECQYLGIKVYMFIHVVAGNKYSSLQYIIQNACHVVFKIGIDIRTLNTEPIYWQRVFFKYIWNNNWWISYKNFLKVFTCN